MTAILSYRVEHDRHTLLLKSATNQLKMSNSLLHFLLKTAILNFYLQPGLLNFYLQLAPKSEQLSHCCLETWLQKRSTLFDGCKFNGQIVKKFLVISPKLCPLLT